MSYQDSPEPIDFDFFDEGPSTKRSSRSDHQHTDPKSNRPLSGKRSGSARGYDGDNDRESVRSVTSSRSSVSVRIPTATPTHDNGNEADYYSDDFDGSDREGDKVKNGHDTFRLKDDIDALNSKGKRHETERGSAQNGKASSKTGTKSRPKSSFRRRRRSDSSSSNASTESSRSSSSFTSESSRSSRDNDSVTDVSPLASPPSSPIPKLEYDEQEMDRETERMRSVHFKDDHPDSYHDYGDSNERRAKSRPKSSKPKDGRKVTKTPGYSQYKEDPRLRETEAKELSMLLRAVLELDETPSESDLSAIHKNLKRPISGKRKNRPQSAPMPHQRMNMSFSNDEVKRIDRDNRRLLEKIVGKPSEPRSSGRTKRPTSAKQSTFTGNKPVSHSAVQRQRDQRRIEIENMQILKRIEAARANPQVKKDALLKGYHQQMQYATQVSKTPGGPRSRPTSAKQSGKGVGMNRASSMSSLGTDYSADTFSSSSTGRSRPRSAKWSGYKAGRPAWDDRFYLDD